jgi:hypothetical protein
MVSSFSAAGKFVEKEKNMAVKIMTRRSSFIFPPVGRILP